MENYLKKVLITKGLDDPIAFAKAQQRIAELEEKRINSFNEYGPLHERYLVINDLLLGAYESRRYAQPDKCGTSYQVTAWQRKPWLQSIYRSGRAYLQDGRDQSSEVLLGFGGDR